MTKSNKAMVKAKNRNARKSMPKPRKQANVLASLGGRVLTHARMVLDPCNAVLGPTAYRGSDGFILRTHKVDTVQAGDSTPYVIFAFYPAYNGVWAQGIADPNAALTPNWATPGPGQTFYLANAESQRPVGACTKLQYTGTELNRGGIVYRGVMPSSALAGSSINTLKALCQMSERTADHTLETKWIPSSADEEYWPTGTVAPTSPGDENVIVNIIQQGTAGVNVPITATTTLIAEWRPKFGLGVQTPTPSTPDAPAGLERVRGFLASMGHWYLEGTRTVATAMRVGASVANSTRALAGAARTVGLLTL